MTPNLSRLRPFLYDACRLAALFVAILGVGDFALVLWVWMVRTPSKVVPLADSVGVVLFGFLALMAFAVELTIVATSLASRGKSLKAAHCTWLIGVSAMCAAFVTAGWTEVLPSWTLEYVQGHSAMLILGIVSALLLLFFRAERGPVSNMRGRK